MDVEYPAQKDNKNSKELKKKSKIAKISTVKGNANVKNRRVQLLKKGALLTN
jgi:hypothetical protein